MKSKTLDLTLTALFAVIISLCSWASIPATVPFTLQTFAVSLTLLILGGKKGTTAILLYILLGAVGLPVFHSFSGGIGVLFGPSGGYVSGFILMGLIYWIITNKAGEKLSIKVLALLLGLVLCYTTGCLQFAFVSDISVKSAVIISVVPFVLPDLIKITLSILLSTRLNKIKQI